MRVRPSPSTSVSRVESAPQLAAASEKEVKNGRAHREEPDPSPGNTDAQDTRVKKLLPPRRRGRLLPAIGEGGLLRDEPAFPSELRLPLGADETESAWRAFHQRLHRFVARRVRQGADAEDIVQKVFLQMHRGRGSLRNADRVGAWLYQAARNAIADHYRSAAGRREVTAGDTRALDARLASDPAGGDDESSLAEAVGCLRPMIGRLPERYRRAIERVELQGLSQRAAAAAEGLSVSGMKTRVQRARGRLKAALLECCRIALDRRGGLLDCESRGKRGPCEPSGCQD